MSEKHNSEKIPSTAEKVKETEIEKEKEDE